MKNINVAVIGHSGRIGYPLWKILENHPKVNIAYTESRGAGAKGSEFIVDVAFLALPHGGESDKYVARFREKRIIDLSLDHRNNIRHWVYGLPEICFGEIKKSERIANPGCYATSVILGLFPLRGKISEVRISSTSGISGVGMKKSEEDNFLVYKEGKKHPQVREITRMLETSDVIFFPQRIDTSDRGIISTIFVKVCKDLNDVEKLFKETYAGCPFVRILDNETSVATKRVIGTNFCDIKIMQFGSEVVIISALDNLMKGGAGQAVQNFNLMCGFPETTGLV